MTDVVCSVKCRWENEVIVVADVVRIASPYGKDDASYVFFCVVVLVAVYTLLESFLVLAATPSMLLLCISSIDWLSFAPGADHRLQTPVSSAEYSA